MTKEEFNRKMDVGCKRKVDASLHSEKNSIRPKDENDLMPTLSEWMELLQQSDKLRRTIQKTKPDETIYFGKVLPIFVHPRNTFERESAVDSRTGGIYGFVDGRFLRIKRSKFQEFGVKEEELIRYVDRDYRQFNKHLIGSDVLALRYAMTLMCDGEPLETLQSFYDKIHNAFEFGCKHDWESIIRFCPSLKERCEERKPERRKISERLFGRYNKEYERFVQKVSVKSIDRVPENTNKITFDYIHVEVSLPFLLSLEEKRAMCEKYIRAIRLHILIVLEENTRFQRFSVPTNILQIEKATIGMDSILYITLGIKDEVRALGNAMIKSKM